MKIPFDIKFRPQIESGEYKVETRGGVRVKLLPINSHNARPIIGELELNGKTVYISTDENGSWTEGNGENQFDLFIITPEPELSEFEERIFKLLRQYKEFDIPLTPENIKAEASMLWQDFEKYFFNLYGKEGEGDSALRSFYYRGLEDGKAKALNDLPRWRKWGNGAAGNSDGHPIALVSGAGGIRFVSILGITGEKYIMLDDLKKLPGFNE